ncbi:MAG: PadR family transcriptional regulator [Actinomycetota bacterium]
MALLRNEKLYGFDLVRKLSDVDGLVTSEGTIYPLLSRLRRDGLVKTFWRESPAGPPRRYYELTTAGTKALDAFSEEWDRFSTAVSLLIKGEDQS